MIDLWKEVVDLHVAIGRERNEHKLINVEVLRDQMPSCAKFWSAGSIRRPIIAIGRTIRSSPRARSEGDVDRRCRRDIAKPSRVQIRTMAGWPPSSPVNPAPSSTARRRERPGVGASAVAFMLLCDAVRRVRCHDQRSGRPLRATRHS